MRKISITIFLFFISQFNVVSASQYSTQDIFLISRIEIIHKSKPLDLLGKIKSEIFNTSKRQFTFPGGATFTSSADNFSGKAIDYFSTLLANSSVRIGVLKKEDETCLAIIVSSDIEQKKRTIGMSDIIDFNITKFIPEDIAVGALGVMDYTLIQTFPPSDPSTEFNYSDIEVLNYRINSGLINIVSTSNWDIAQISNFPFIVGNGSKTLRFFGKGILAIGTTGAGVIVGASFGSAVPAVGTLIGGILGGSTAFLTSVGNAIVDNTKDDISGEALMAPVKFIPNTRKPTTIEIDIDIDIDTRIKIDIPEATGKINYYGQGPEPVTKVRVE